VFEAELTGEPSSEAAVEVVALEPALESMVSLIVVRRNAELPDVAVDVAILIWPTVQI